MVIGSPFDKFYTVDEAAERLRLKNRGLIKIAKRIGACSLRGRTFLFSEADTLAIWEELRTEPAAARMKDVSRATPSKSRLYENLRWMSYSPPTAVDRRLLCVWTGLLGNRRRRPTRKSSAPAQKINELLRLRLVNRIGTDVDGLARVRIAPAGREQNRIYETWKLKKKQRRGQ